VGTLNYIVDPLLYYQRAKRVFPVLYSQEQREQVPGIIKNSKSHNAAIMGTSLAGNYLVSEVSDALNEKTVKLTVNGATFSEQSFILSRYLETHPDAKIVIWAVDTFYIDVAPGQFTIREYDYPFYLYESIILNPRYLLGYNVTIHSIQTIANDLFGINSPMKTQDIDRLHTWPEGTPLGCKPVIANYDDLAGRDFKVVDPSLTPLPEFNEANAAANMEKITALARDNSRVKFYIYLPPYSIVRFLFEKQGQGLERLMKARDFFAKKTEGINNISILDFQASEEIITDLNNYMDMLHHNRKINRLIIDVIVNGNFSDYGSVIENTEKLRKIVNGQGIEKIRKCAQAQ
ncbi:MAG: hypothetical protein OEU95_08160, partial [Nitrospirota bacterium]|nr:hypothetical protein [Nitrospirota bacterium]